MRVDFIEFPPRGISATDIVIVWETAGAYKGFLGGGAAEGEAGKMGRLCGLGKNGAKWVQVHGREDGMRIPGN